MMRAARSFRRRVYRHCARSQQWFRPCCVHDIKAAQALLSDKIHVVSLSAPGYIYVAVAALLANELAAAAIAIYYGTGSRQQNGAFNRVAQVLRAAVCYVFCIMPAYQRAAQHEIIKYTLAVLTEASAAFLTRQVLCYVVIIIIIIIIASGIE